MATTGTGRQEAKTIPWNHHQVAKEFILVLQQKMNGPFIAWQDFSCGLTTCAALSVFSVQRTHLPGAGLLLLQSCKSFLSSDRILSKGSLQVAAKMTEVILITSGALPSSVSRLWILEGIKVRCYSWVFRSPSPFSCSSVLRSPMPQSCALLQLEEPRVAVTKMLIYISLVYKPVASILISILRPVWQKLLHSAYDCSPLPHPSL